MSDLSDRGAAKAGRGIDSMSTAHAAAAVVLTSLALLVLIRRGFRGVSLKGI